MHESTGPGHTGPEKPNCGGERAWAVLMNTKLRMERETD